VSEYTKAVGNSCPTSIAVSTRPCPDHRGQYSTIIKQELERPSGLFAKLGSRFFLRNDILLPQTLAHFGLIIGTFAIIHETVL